MKKILLLIVIFSSTLHAQDSYLEGRIYADSIEDYQVNIINVDQEIGTVSTTEGNFKIKAKVGDSILFTSLQHKTQTLKVKAQNLKTSTSIFLELQINELPEVTLNPYDLTGDLAKDITKVKVDFVDQRKFGFNVPRILSVEQRKLRAAYASSAGVPLDFVLMSLSGQLQELKKQMDIVKLQSDKNKLLRRVDASLILKDLKIPKLYIEDFAYFCAEDEDTIAIMEKNDPLAFIDELKSKATAYLKLKEIKP